MHTILRLLTTLTLFFFTLPAFSQPAIQWQRCLGGDSLDGSASVCPTADGGYIVAGRTASVNGDLAPSTAGQRTWVVKLDGTGNTAWQAVYPDIISRQIHQTTDGGYIITGYVGTMKLTGTGALTWSVQTAGTSIQQTSDGGYILCDGGSAITKLAATGSVTWVRAVLPATGILAVQHQSVRQTSDGGYILASLRVDEPSNEQAYVTKTNDTGGVVWTTAVNSCVTGCGLYYAEQTPDGGYITTGGSTAMLNASGGVVWNKFYLKGTFIHPAASGGYLMLGSSPFPYDLVLRHLSSAGDTLQQKVFGGSATEFPYDMRVARSADGGAIVAGYTASSDGDVSGYHGGGDIWIVKFSGAFLGMDAAPKNSVRDIAVYPTLTHGEVFVTLTAPGVRVDDSRITDIAGREVSVPTEQTASGLKMDLRGRPAGVYLLRLRTTTGHSAAHRIIHQP